MIQVWGDRNSGKLFDETGCGRPDENNEVWYFITNHAHKNMSKILLKQLTYIISGVFCQGKPGFNRTVFQMKLSKNIAAGISGKRYFVENNIF